MAGAEPALGSRDAFDGLAAAEQELEEAKITLATAQAVKNAAEEGGGKERGAQRGRLCLPCIAVPVADRST